MISRIPNLLIYGPASYLRTITFRGSTPPLRFPMHFHNSYGRKAESELYNEASAVCIPSKYLHTRTRGFQWAYRWDRTTGNAYGGEKKY